MAAEHEPNSWDPFEQGPDVAPQATHHEVSPGNGRELRRRVLTFIGHVLCSRHRQDTHNSFCLQKYSVRGMLLLTTSQLRNQVLQGLFAHTRTGCPEGTRSHCPRIGQNQKHVGCVIGSLNKDVKMARWVLWTTAEAVNRKRTPWSFSSSLNHSAPN